MFNWNIQGIGTFFRDLSTRTLKEDVVEQLHEKILIRRTKLLKMSLMKMMMFLVMTRMSMMHLNDDVIFFNMIYTTRKHNLNEGGFPREFVVKEELRRISEEPRLLVTHLS